MDYAIIAAGEGSRLVQEGMKTPKPLIRLHGVPLIDRLIHIFLRHHATSISIIVNEEMTEVQAHLKALSLPVPMPKPLRGMMWPLVTVQAPKVAAAPTLAKTGSG